MPVDVNEELFRSANLVVRRRGESCTRCCVVTFGSFTDERTLDRPGFGEGFFQSRGIDAIHVISRENDWYQYPEMEAAVAQVHAATRSYARVVTYGSSMGAYAAIRLGGLAGAHCALAMSPQYSIDPAVVRFEKRWRDSSAQFTSVWERRLPLPKLPEAFLAFDPGSPDGRHVELFRRGFAFTPVPLVQAGHTVSGYLQEVGLLQDVVLSVCDGTFDVPALIAEAWRRREQSPQHFVARADQSSKSAERLALFAEAVRMAPGHVGCISKLAMELSRNRRFAEALMWHRKAVALAPGNPAPLALYSTALQRSGDNAAALAVMEEVAAITGGAAVYAKRLQVLRNRVRVDERAKRRREVWRQRLQIATRLRR